VCLSTGLVHTGIPLLFQGAIDSTSDYHETFKECTGALDMSGFDLTSSTRNLACTSTYSIVRSCRPMPPY
jgi:hypothetical protein